MLRLYSYDRRFLLGSYARVCRIGRDARWADVCIRDGAVSRRQASMRWTCWRGIWHWRLWNHSTCTATLVDGHRLWTHAWVHDGMVIAIGDEKLVVSLLHQDRDHDGADTGVYMSVSRRGHGEVSGVFGHRVKPWDMVMWCGEKSREFDGYLRLDLWALHGGALHAVWFHSGDVVACSSGVFFGVMALEEIYLGLYGRYRVVWDADAPMDAGMMPRMSYEQLAVDMVRYADELHAATDAASATRSLRRSRR